MAYPQFHSLRAGITGGMGSGKSTVCRIFETLGVAVYDADTWAKRLVEEDGALKEAIVDLLGAEAYGADGRYNRPYVAGAVFSDAAKLEALNALIHPAVEKHSAAWHLERAGEGHAYTLKEAALLVESGSYQRLEALLVVTAPEAVRVRRVMARDGLEEAEVRLRLSRQMPEAEKAALADRVIVNDGEHALIPQVLAAHRFLLDKAATRR